MEDNMNIEPNEENQTPVGQTVDPLQLEMQAFSNQIQQIISECGKYIVGQRELIELMICCILADGHILLEGVPGIAKTLAAKVMSKTIDADFSRIQFTPDLMPSDILGTSVFNMNKSEFVFKKGPIFSNVILIDEINRAPAKTQAALFEVMEEKQISYDGIQYEMTKPFVVIATQNPIEQEGTYRLPEAQLDRFLMKLVLDYPSQKEELQILIKFKDQIGVLIMDDIQKILDSASIDRMQKSIAKIHIEDQMLEYIIQIIHETRNNSKIYLGASPRASLAIMRTSKIIAAMSGRGFIIPDDIQYVAPFVLNHRIILTPDAEMEGTSSLDVLNDILKTIEVPR